MSIRPALVGVAAAALALLPLGVANAQTYRHADPKGDVAEQPVDSTSDTGTPAPGVKDPDVTHLTVRHAAGTVSVTLRLRDLARSGDAEGVVVYLRTNEHVRREVDLFAGPGAWGGTTDFSAPHRALQCKGLRHRLDYTHNVATLSVPRSCLSRPRWVQAGVGAVKMAGSTAYADDAQSKTVSGNQPVWSPRIHHG